MKLKIKNYKCISDINFELDEHKLNFIYGISGSGKTSISEIIKNYVDNIEYDEGNKKIDSTEDIDIDIEGLDVETIKIFNDETIRDFIFNKEREGLYKIIYQPSNELIELEEEIGRFNKSNIIRDIRGKLISFNYNFKQLEEKLGIKFTSKGKLIKNVAIKELSKKESFDTKYTNSQIKWLNDGISDKLGFNVEGICPFCEQNIEESLINKIQELDNLRPDAIKKIQENTNILDELNVSTKDINKIEDGEKLKKEIIDLLPINEDAKKLLQMLDNSYGDGDNIEPVVISDRTQDYFSENYNIDLKDKLSVINTDKQNYLRKCKEYKGKFIRNIDINIAKINKELHKLYIPYKLEKKLKFNQEEEYEIIHIKDNQKKKKNLITRLSTGEKNILSLLLFLIVNGDDNVIIDDPASSFDEYKRSIILKVINDMRKEKDKFTLVLSHDQIFLKFLLKDYSDSWNSYIFENTLVNNIKKIEKEDMNTLINHIKYKLKENISYEEQIINLRMYYEINKVSKENIYSYLSAILHGKPKIEVCNELSNKNLTEKEILEDIRREVDVDLVKYDNCNFNSIYLKLSDFEKIFVKREELKGDEKRIFNDVVHFNYGLIHMINPYVYNFQVKEIYEKI